jgi:hypothetical protein
MHCRNASNGADAVNLQRESRAAAGGYNPDVPADAEHDELHSAFGPRLRCAEGNAALRSWTFICSRGRFDLRNRRLPATGPQNRNSPSTTSYLPSACRSSGPAGKEGGAGQQHQGTAAVEGSLLVQDVASYAETQHYAAWVACISDCSLLTIIADHLCKPAGLFRAGSRSPFSAFDVEGLGAQPKWFTDGPFAIASGPVRVRLSPGQSEGLHSFPRLVEMRGKCR